MSVNSGYLILNDKIILKIKEIATYISNFWEKFLHAATGDVGISNDFKTPVIGFTKGKPLFVSAYSL